MKQRWTEFAGFPRLWAHSSRSLRPASANIRPRSVRDSPPRVSLARVEPIGGFWRNEWFNSPPPVCAIVALCATLRLGRPAKLTRSRRCLRGLRCVVVFHRNEAHLPVLSTVPTPAGRRRPAKLGLAFERAAAGGRRGRTAVLQNQEKPRRVIGLRRGPTGQPELPPRPARQAELTDGGLLLQEGVKTENDHINLKVAGQDGSVVQFKIKRHTALSKLMKAYCERQVCCCPFSPPHIRGPQEPGDVAPRSQAPGALALHVYCPCTLNKKGPFLPQGLSMRQIRFRFDGQPINEQDTPAQVGQRCTCALLVFFSGINGVL